MDIIDIVKFPGYDVSTSPIAGIEEEKLPFWYLFSALFPTATTDNFESAIKILYPDIDDNPEYGTTEGQQTFVNDLLNPDNKTNIEYLKTDSEIQSDPDILNSEIILDLDNISSYSIAENLSPYDMSVQEFIRTSYIIGANDSLEREIRSLIDTTEFIDELDQVLTHLAGQYNNKGGDDSGDGVLVQTDIDAEAETSSPSLVVTSSLSDGTGSSEIGGVPPNSTISSNPEGSSDEHLKITTSTAHGLSEGDVIQFNSADQYFTDNYFKVSLLTPSDEDFSTGFYISNNGEFIAGDDPVFPGTLKNTTITAKLFQAAEATAEGTEIKLTSSSDRIEKGLSDPNIWIAPYPNTNNETEYANFVFPTSTGLKNNQSNGNAISWDTGQKYNFKDLTDPSGILEGKDIYAGTVNDDKSATLHIHDGDKITEATMNYLATHNESIELIKNDSLSTDEFMYANDYGKSSPLSISPYDNNSDPAFYFFSPGASAEQLRAGQTILFGEYTNEERKSKFIAQEFVINSVDYANDTFKIGIKDDFNGLEAGRLITKGMMDYNNLTNGDLTITSITNPSSMLTRYDSTSSEMTITEAEKINAALNDNVAYAGLSALKIHLSTIIDDIVDKEYEGTDSLLTNLNKLLADMPELSEDNNNPSNNIGGWIEWQLAGGQDAWIQNSMTGTTNLNENYNYSIRRMMYNMDQFYTSANTVIRKINSILKSIAKHVER